MLREKAEQAQAAARQAQAEAARAEAAVHQAQDTGAQFSKKLAALDAKVAEADGLIKNAPDDDNRKAAMAQLDEARKQKLELLQVPSIRKECLENLLAKGCP